MYGQELQPVTPKEGATLALSPSGFHSGEVWGAHIYAWGSKASCWRETWAPKLSAIEDGKTPG